MVQSIQAFFCKVITTAVASLLIVFLMGVQVGFGQTELINEELRDGELPPGWSEVDIDFRTSAGGYALFEALGSELVSPVFDGSAFAIINVEFDVAKFGSGDDGPITVEYSLNSGSEWHTLGESPVPTDANYLTADLDITNVSENMRLRFTRLNSPSGKRLRDLIVTGEGTAGSPVLVSSPVSISGLNYAESNGPSDPQTFELSGSHLDGSNVTVTAPANFEISKEEEGTYESTVTLSSYDGSSQTIWVRLASDLDIDKYDGNIVISGGDADPVNVSVDGEVVEAFAIPYSNGLRNETDFDLAVAQGFNFVDASLSTTAGGRIDISTDGFIETPEINFTQFDEIRTTFDLRNFGGGSNRELTVKVSNDGGSNFTSVEVIPVDIPDDPYETFNVDIDVTGANSVSNGIIRFEKTGGTGGIRFRDLSIGELIEASVELTGTEGFRMLSAPVEVSLEDYLSPIWTQGATEGADTDAGDPNVFTWDIGTGEWSEVTNLTSANVTAGTGVLVFVFEKDDPNDPGFNVWPKTLSVTGAENAANVSPTVNTSSEGFTLLGNPFATPIAFEDLSTEGLTGTIYVWDANDETGDGGGDTGEYDPGAGSWKTWSGSAGDITDGIIRPFQGFFVQNVESPSNTPSVTFPEVAKATGGSFFGKVNESDSKIVRLEMNGENMRNSMWMQFSEAGSLDGQIRGDALKLNPLSDTFSQLAVEKKGTLFDVSHLPIQNVEYTIPVHISATAGGSYTLTATDYDLPGDFELTFNDHSNGSSVPITADFKHTVELAQAAKTAEISPLERIKQGPVAAKAREDAKQYSITVSIGEAVSIDAPDELPQKLSLSQNFPNPFNPVTVINFDISRQSHVRLAVYDLLGRQVDVLVNDTRERGSYDVTWDASRFSSGVYFYHLEADGQSLTRRMTLIK